MHNNIEDEEFWICLFYRWRTREVVLTLLLYQLVVRLRGIPRIKLVFLLEMRMETRFLSFLYIFLC